MVLVDFVSTHRVSLGYHMICFVDIRPTINKDESSHEFLITLFGYRISQGMVKGEANVTYATYSNLSLRLCDFSSLEI